MKPVDSEMLFDEVMKKSLVYSQKYSTGGGQNKGLATLKPSLLSTDKRNNSSAKSDLSVSDHYKPS